MSTPTAACLPNRRFCSVYCREPEYAFNRIRRLLFSLSSLARISSPDGATVSAVRVRISACEIAKARNSFTGASFSEPCQSDRLVLGFMIVDSSASLHLLLGQAGLYRLNLIQNG